MVKGLNTFRKYFEKYEEQYVLIGGAACDLTQFKITPTKQFYHFRERIIFRFIKSIELWFFAIGSLISIFTILNKIPELFSKLWR